MDKGEEVERGLRFQVHTCTGQFCHNLKERAELAKLEKIPASSLFPDSGDVPSADRKTMRSSFNNCQQGVCHVQVLGDSECRLLYETLQITSQNKIRMNPLYRLRKLEDKK